MKNRIRLLGLALVLGSLPAGATDVDLKACDSLARRLPGTAPEDVPKDEVLRCVLAESTRLILLLSCEQLVEVRPVERGNDVGREIRKKLPNTERNQPVVTPPIFDLGQDEGAPVFLGKFSEGAIEGAESIGTGRSLVGRVALWRCPLRWLRHAQWR